MLEQALSSRDGTALSGRIWPAAAPRAVVALVHGLAEHGGRYAAFAERLNRAGISLVTVDLRGHGRSAGARARVRHFDDYLDDAEALLALAGRHCPAGVPLFLMGHSMGGAIAALWAIERLPASGVALAGLILSSPALSLGADVPRWMIALSQVIGRLAPGLPVRRIDAALLSRDPLVVADNRADPLVHHGGVPARTGAELIVAMRRIAAGRQTLTLPVRVFHGTADRLTEPDGSREFAAGVGSADVDLALYPDNYHETLNDLDRDRVINELIGWIEGAGGCLAKAGDR